MIFGKWKRRMHVGPGRCSRALHGMPVPVTIGDLPCGASGIVCGIHAEGTIRQRLMDLGITEGAHVQMIRRAPLGDPVQIKVRDTLVALRKSEADTLHIEPFGDSCHGPHSPRRRAGR